MPGLSLPPPSSTVPRPLLSFSEIAARTHCKSYGIFTQNKGCCWKRTLLPVRFQSSWDSERKHPSVNIRDAGSAVFVSPGYTRGTYMTVFDSMPLDLRSENVVYSFRVRLNADTSRAGVTVGVVDPRALNPSKEGGCELCESPRGWGVFVCKGLRDKFTNGVYNGGKYICGRESKDIRYGWSKDDVIEVRLRRGEIYFLRNDEIIEEVHVRNREIVGPFVFAITLYNSRLEVKSLDCVRRLSLFEDPKLGCLSTGECASPAASKGAN